MDKYQSVQPVLYHGGGPQWLEHRTRDRKVAGSVESLLERRENFLLQGRLSVLTLISVSVPPPCYCSSTWKILVIPAAKSTGGRLQLNTHTPYVYGFAWSDMEHGCMVYTGLAPRRLQFHVAPANASAVSTPLRWIYKKKIFFKRAIKLVTHVEPHASAVTRVCTRERRIALYQRSSINHCTCDSWILEHSHRHTPKHSFILLISFNENGLPSLRRHQLDSTFYWFHHFKLSVGRGELE